MNRRASRFLDNALAFAQSGLWTISPPCPNTLDEAPAYEGRPLEELFPAPPRVPAVAFRRRWLGARLLCEDLQFESLHEPLAPRFRERHFDEYPSNRFVYARWLRHVGGPRRPTMIYLHGWMQFEAWLEEATLMPAMARRLGVDVIHMQLPYHGRRKPPGSLFHGEYFWTADVVRTMEAIRQSVLDARSLLSWLESQGCGPVGVAGISLGGALTEALICLEPRLAFAYPFVAHMDLAGALAEAPILRRMRRELRGFGWGPEELEGFMRRAGWEDMRPAIPLERILIIAAKYDVYLTPERVETMWKSWGEPPIYWFPGGHIGILGYWWPAIVEMKRHLRGLGIGPGERRPA